MANILDFNEKHAQDLEAAEMAKKSTEKFMGSISLLDPISKVQIIDKALEELAMRDAPVANAATIALLKERQDLEDAAKRQAEETEKRNARIKELEKEMAEGEKEIAKLKERLAIARQKEEASQPKPPVPDRSTKPKFTERVEARRAELANQEISK